MYLLITKGKGQGATMQSSRQKGNIREEFLSDFDLSMIFCSFMSSSFILYLINVKRTFYFSSQKLINILINQKKKPRNIVVMKITHAK